MHGILALLLTLLFVCFIFGIIGLAIQKWWPGPTQPFALAIVGLFFVVVLISLLLGGAPIGTWHVRW